MAKHDDIGRLGRRHLHDLGIRQWAKFAIDERDLMPIVNQRPTDREQPKRRQMIVGNPATDRGMRNVDKNNTHLPYTPIRPLLPNGSIVNEQARLIYYTAQAANRRHFQILFFAVTGFSWSFALALFAVLAPFAFLVALSASGLPLIGGSFIAWRLLLRERSAFGAMIAAWLTISGQADTAPSGGSRPGAMAIACGAQASFGFTLIAASLVR